MATLSVFHRNHALGKSVHFKPPLRKALPKYRALLVALGLAALFSGCASIDPAPFTQFASTLSTLRDNTDTQAVAAATASRKDLIEKIADGKAGLADLQLQFDTSSNPFASTYSSAESEPNYVKFNRFQQGLLALNNAMIAYAQSLVVLAGGGKGGDILPTAEQFDRMADDLNANAGSAAAALGIRLDPGKQAFLSTVAIEIFKGYIGSKRRGALGDAIAEVQPQVEEFATAAQQAVRLLASLVKTDYLDKLPALIRKANSVRPIDATPILDFNDATQATLGTLASVWDSYHALPAAHRDLSAAASEKPTRLVGLAAFGEAARLQSLITKRTAANEALATPPN